MCSVQDGDNDIPLKKEKSSISKTCMKCKEEKAVLVTRVNDAFCRSCFMVYVTHKFRAAIGKSKLIRDGEQVLVGYSGDPSSSCLLHLIEEGLSGRAHKKLRFRPGLVFIDEGCVLGISPEERKQIRENVQLIMENTGYPCYIKSLEEVMEYEDSDKELSVIETATRVPDPHGNQTTSHPLQHEEAELKLKSLFESLKSVSAKEELLRHLRQQLMVSVAKQHNYSKIMVGDCGTRLSIRLLSDIAQGRGAHVSMETSFADKRNKDLLCVRPIRDFSTKEVAMYNSFCNVDTVFIPTLTTKASSETSSIEHLTESFVTGLQTEYLSTVSNIIRTGEKLSTEEDSDQCCALCQAPLDTAVGASSALNAVEFSQKVSRKRTEGDQRSEESSCCGEGDGSCQSKSQSLTKEDIQKSLCYGCRLIINDLSDTDKLPSYLLRDISWRTRRSKMKSDIEDFLL